MLTLLQGGAATLSDICTQLKAKQQQHAITDIMKELQDDFEVALKAGEYFLL